MAGEINFGILDPKLGASFATGYNEAENRRNELAAQVQQRALGEQQLQQAMSQNELSKYTLSSAKRSDAQREALDAYVNNPSFNPKDPAQLQKLMGFGEAGRGMLKAVMDRATSEATLAKTRGEVNAQDFKAAKDRHDALAGALGPLAAAIQAGKPVTHNDVFGAAQQLLGSNVISQKDLASIPMQAERLPQYIMGLVASNENSRKALEMYLSKPGIAGGQIVEMNPLLKVGSRIADVSPVASPFSGLINERAALPFGDSRREEYDRKINKESTFAPPPVTNIKMPPQQGAEQAERGKMLVSEYSDLSKAAKLAVRTIPSIDANLNILSSGFETGFGTETVAAGASVLAAFGVQNAEKFATNSQIFRAKASEAVLQKQLEQKGTQTKSDSDRIEEIGAQLGKTTAGNKFVLTTAREQLKRDIEQRNFYDSWWKSNKTYDGAESAWYAGEGNKSLFDRPALKQYAAAQIPGQNAAVNMPEQNTTNISVTLPDGRVKTFPNAEAANQFKKAAGIK
jgi:hypothetical protein